MKLALIAAAAAALLLAGCASSSIVPMSKNRVAINTRAAPICRTTGATSVATKMAAVETIKRGYERFIVLGFGAQNNTRVVTTGPTYSTTTGSARVFGNSVYGSSRTKYGGQMTTLAGGNDAQMEVVMLNRGDSGFEQGVDAKDTLGPDWRKVVEDGINTCF